MEPSQSTTELPYGIPNKLSGPDEITDTEALLGRDLGERALQHYNPNAKRDTSYDIPYHPYYEEIDSNDKEEDWEQKEIEELRALQAKHEEKAQSIRTSMSTDKPARLGKLRGKWTLYSSQSLNACIEMPNNYIDECWTAGELKITDPNPDDYPISFDAEFVLSGTELDWFGMDLKIPKFASSTPVTRVGVSVEGEVHRFQVTFLDRHLIELHAPRSVLLDSVIGPDLYYVAIRAKSMEEIFCQNYDYIMNAYYQHIIEDSRRWQAKIKAEAKKHVASDANSEKSWETEDEWTDEE